ncbi:helix-turn-helix domain-containing protein [Actinoplanes sp. NPDC049599]|uniref:helix-turn-helix domain-containing protein n=1 Tax=Actinoplanes sp. NPDC049599 TaxID=3363903 RepID=UPI0037911B67
MFNATALTKTDTEAPADTHQPARSAATYTVKEVASMLRLSLGGTYQAIRAGEIPAKRIRGRWIVPVHRFHAWLDAQDDDAAAGHLAA